MNTTDATQTITNLRATGRTVRQIAAALGCATSTIYRWARGTYRPSARYAAALTALEAAMNAPLVYNAKMQAVGGPAAVIRAALNGAHPLTITGKHANGDIVWCAPRERQVWGVNADAVTVESQSIAHTMTHPVHGEIVYAYIDMTRLDRAPQIAEAARQTTAAYAAAEARAAAMVPACGNCGDCPRCC